MKLYIKHMVSSRCKTAVGNEMKKLGLKYSRLELGMVDLPGGITVVQHEQLKWGLVRSGLHLIEDKRSILIEKIKTTIVSMIHAEDQTELNYSRHISKELCRSYMYLANLFSRVSGMTIRQFIIRHKIERAKELLLDNDLNLTEIACKLNYSSVAHLSNQFRKTTGLTPSLFKQLRPGRTCLENL